MRSTMRRARDSRSSGFSSSLRSWQGVGVQAPVGAGGLLDLGEERVERLGGAGEGAQRVEANDVARAFPDRGQRLLAVAAGEREGLDVAVAAQALKRLKGVAGAALAHPVLRTYPGRVM